MGVVAGQYMIPSDFSKRIKRLRQKMGLSRKDLAELLDVSSTLVKQWESGRLQPSVQEWQRIALAESGGISALRSDVQRTIRSNSSRFALPAVRIAMRLRNRCDVAGEIDRGGIDRQGTSPWCLVEAVVGHLACLTARNCFLPDRNCLISRLAP